MKKFTKYISLSLMSVACAGFMTSCDNTKDNDDFTMAQGTTPNVYFPMQSTQDIALGDNDTEFSFYVYRASKTGSESAQLSWSGEYDGFNVPTSVTFADGADVAQATVTFDVANLKGSYPYDMTVTVAGTQDSGFTQSSLSFVVVYTSWQELGNGIYTDYFVGAFFGVENISYYVEVLEHPEIKGLYRLVNPYGEAYPYNEPGDWDDSEDSFMYINANNPEKVFISNKDGEPDWYESTMDWGYGIFSFTTYASYYLMNGNSAAAADYYGYVKEGIIYIAAGSPICDMADYGTSVNAISSDSEWLELPE